MRAGAYLRKSNDEGEKSEDIKSVTRQRDRCREYAAAKGWTLDDRYVFTDDGVSGFEFKKRPGLRALLDALEPVAPFQILIVSEQSRLGRDAIRTLGVIQEIIEADVAIYSYLDDRPLTLGGSDKIVRMVTSYSDEDHGTKTGQRITDTLRKRAENGHVAGGRVYGYRNHRSAPKAPVTRIAHDGEAAVIRRVFEQTRDGLGLTRIAKQLNAEGIPGPRDLWTPTGVREVLCRDLYRGIAIYGRITRGRKKGVRTRTHVADESKWIKREAPELRVVSDELWDAAHAQTAATSARYLRRGNQLIAQAESAKGKFLLSGFLACGAEAVSPRANGGTACGAPLVAVKRGRNLRASYICRGHREKGDTFCTNTTAVPMSEIHSAVILSLRETFTPESFEAHLKKSAADEGAREARAAERATLLARIPVLTAEAERLADAVAAGHGSLDVLLDAIKARQAEREAAEARVAELEGIERDLRADEEAVKTLRKTWGNWAGALEADPILARQVLRKVLGAPISVRPEGGRGDRSWAYAGVGRFDEVLRGGVARGVIVPVHRSFGPDRPVCSRVSDTEMAPQSPNTRSVPAEP